MSDNIEVLITKLPLGRWDVFDYTPWCAAVKRDGQIKIFGVRDSYSKIKKFIKIRGLDHSAYWWGDYQRAIPDINRYLTEKYCGK